MDRSSLINDAFSLAESGHIDYSIPLSMTKYLKKEKDYVPWEGAFDKLLHLEMPVENEIENRPVNGLTEVR